MLTCWTWHADMLQSTYETPSLSLLHNSPSLPLYSQDKRNTIMTYSGISSSSERLCVFVKNKSLRVKLASQKIINSAAEPPLKHWL